jgi:hypothetical protein
MSNPDFKSVPTANQVACWAHTPPTEQLKTMFVDTVQAERIALGQKPAKRPVFLKPHGVAHGYFEPLADLPSDQKIGVFALGELQAWVRFSSDTAPTSPDFKTTCGVGLKLFGVPGPKLLGQGDTHDFLFQNFDVFFVNDAKDMAEFTTAGVIDHDYDAYLAKHPVTRRISDEMEKAVTSTLATPYWGVLPYAFGAERFVKYKLEPVDQPTGEPFNDANYLAIDLQNRLLHGPATFKFMVQWRTDPATMPLDKATVRWPEAQSPFVQIATLHLPQQDICAPGQASYGENLAFNPWHCLPEHAPQGSISDARKVVYEASAVKRHTVNGLPTQEPGEPRVAQSTQAAGAAQDDECIVSAAIYPPIGVCRVGNSQDEFFIGPEVTRHEPRPQGFYRDARGALKRQAARFRIYGLNAQGKPVKELIGDDTQVHWTVHLANQKSAWYEFQLALDIPEAVNAAPSLLRNATVSDRSSLRIDPGACSIAGSDQSSHALHGSFMGTSVYLGELKTDAQGRLIVLGGRGKSASIDDQKAVTFANNDGWYDDTSDGPVTATVTYQGVALKVQPAWVITAPPDYAPLQKSVRTMWDLMRDTAIQACLLAQPTMPSFTHDILPIFERMTHLQWVNAGFASAFGFGGAFNFTTPEWLHKLSDNGPANRELRKNLANQFRRFERDAWSPVPFPWLYGDAMNLPPAATPRQHASLSNTQLAFLDQWAMGSFIADYDPAYCPPLTIDDVPAAQQADMLTQAAMEFCLADAFHPGCEMTWPMRTAGMYLSAFRLKHAPAGWTEPNYGAQLNSDVTTLPSGPLLGGQLPGGITRWMAIPWQTDTASCRSGYVASYDPYVPTFWPARVPNQVMSEAQYEVVMDTSLQLGQRLQAFANRASWLEPLGLDKPYTHQINHMIAHFDELGVVESRAGLPNDANFPAMMQVQETKREAKAQAHDATRLASGGWRHLKPAQASAAKEFSGSVDGFATPAGAGKTDLSKIDKVRRFTAS